MGVLFGGPVKGRRDDLTFHASTDVGHFLGTLVYEQHHEVHLGIIRLDRLSDLLHDGGLAGLGR